SHHGPDRGGGAGPGGGGDAAAGAGDPLAAPARRLEAGGGRQRGSDDGVPVAHDRVAGATGRAAGGGGGTAARPGCGVVVAATSVVAGPAAGAGGTGGGLRPVRAGRRLRRPRRGWAVTPAWTQPATGAALAVGDHARHRQREQPGSRRVLVVRGRALRRRRDGPDQEPVDAPPGVRVPDEDVTVGGDATDGATGPLPQRPPQFVAGGRVVREPAGGQGGHAAEVVRVRAVAEPGRGRSE